MPADDFIDRLPAPACALIGREIKGETFGFLVYSSGREIRPGNGTN
jgi:hypothetical protein